MIKKHINKPLIKYEFIIFVWVVLLTACTGSPVSTKTPIQTPGQISIVSTTAPLQKTPGITSTLKPTRTATVSPTNTARPPTRTATPCPPFEIDHQRPDPDIVEGYIGRHYDTRNLPEGLENIGGFLIGDNDYALSRLKWTENRMMWWLEKLVCRNRTRAYFEIVDAIASPPLYENETVTYVCFPGDEKLPITAAVGTFDKNSPVVVLNGDVGQVYDEVRFAMYLNIETKELIPVSTEGVVCLELIGLGPDP